MLNIQTALAALNLYKSDKRSCPFNPSNYSNQATAQS
jgi:hypothetical protein